LLDVPDGLSVPVVRSGNTGKSRFQGLSLWANDPCAVQNPVLSDPTSANLVQVRSRARGPHADDADHGVIWRAQAKWRRKAEGASEGYGLGFEFLKHMRRCRVLLHLIDGTRPTR